jgi:peptidoglycan/LPS O-acetylase OafA/YrhL
LDLFILLWMLYMCLPGIEKSGTLIANLLFPVNAPYFAAGMLFYRLQQANGQTWQRYGLLLLTYALSVRHALDRAALYSAKFHTEVSGVVATVLVTLFFVLLYLVAFRKIRMTRFSWLMWLGGLTYPLYLVHDDMGFIAFHYLGNFLNKYVLLGLMLAVMLTVSFLIHVLVEKRYSRALGALVERCLDKFAHNDPLAPAEVPHRSQLVRQKA